MRKNLLGQKFGRLTVIKDLKSKWLCRCECCNEITATSHALLSGDLKSCGCLKVEQDEKNLRDAYDDKRVNGVATQLFKGKEPRKDSSTGFRGVSKYLTRKSKETRYRAWITVKGKRYYKSGFMTADEAYYKGRIMLEDKYLPKDPRN
ncbi:hypothetical protein [Enterococcus nangangensis]|uniref:hypothetical protein n=1 Tax=Enterococcus nangangensis TaxID=2559926 RepID=UPI0010F53805|nr:hypothetical protein [Enterococcus nangangensis]